jgi:hypothetical protein
VSASPVDRAVRSARRRLFTQLLLDRLVLGWTVALGVGLAWSLAEPLVLGRTTEEARWVVLGSLVFVGTVVAVVRAARRRPSPLAAALELDSRFDLRERATSVISLPSELFATQSGRALLADAEKHTTPLKVREQFPVGPRRSAVRIPLLAGLIAVVAFVYHPVTDSEAWAEAKKKQDDAANEQKVADAGKKGPGSGAPRTPKPDQLQRANRSPKLKELEEELDRLEREAREANQTPETAREKVSEITSAEEKAKAYQREKQDRLARIEQKFQQLEQLSQADDFKDGPAREFNDALAKGDLKKAEEAVDELRKKVKDKKLDEKDTEQLEEQLDRMKDELQRLARNKEQQEKLKDLIDKAKREGRDAESLERELERAKAEAQRSKGLEDLAQKLEKTRQAMKAGDLEEAAKQLEGVAGQLQELQGEVQDLEDVRESLQRLKELKEGACKACEGDGKGQGSKPGQKPGHKDNASGGGVASGDRPEDRDATTGRGPEERQRSPFDPKGRKQYAGAVAGPAFTKKSPTQLGQAIDQAVQEAPDAIANQPVSRDDKDAVKEFYKKK